MMPSHTHRTTCAALAIAVGACVLALAIAQGSQQPPPPGSPLSIDPDDIGGIVSGPKGPEAGVWVIAETRDLGVRFIRIVVTDERGRFVVPDLPAATYDVWARGYGLVDGPKVKSAPGKVLDVAAVPAPTAAAAAHYYPAIYWYSMLRIPRAQEFGREGGTIPKDVTHTAWLDGMKSNGCIGCHRDRPAIHAHHPVRARHVQLERRGVDPPGAVRPVWRDDAAPIGLAGADVARALRRLERSHRQG